MAAAEPPHWMKVAHAGEDSGTSSMCVIPSGSAHTTTAKCRAPSR